MRTLHRVALATFSILVASTGLAAAHMSITPGITVANKSQKITFGIGHGCDGADTYKVVIDVPAGVDATTVRGVHDGQFGTPTVTTDVDGTHVTWTKEVADILPADTGYYELSVRARTPNLPFTRLQWNTHQYCKAPVNGDPDLFHHWIDAPGGGANSAPMMTLMPATKLTGWNEFVVPAAIAEDDLPTYFGDAQIVWLGNAAFSSNPVIAALIAITPGVTALTTLAVSDAVLVKY